MPWVYPPELAAILLTFGLRPTPDTPPALVRDALSDLYRYELRRMRDAGQQMPIEIEAQSLEEVDRALEGQANIILLDNLTTADIEEAVRRIAGRAQIEISGGITLERIPELARTGAHYVSIGALTHSAPAADLSFEIERDA